MTEPRNLVKVEQLRVSGVPIDVVDSFNQGDLMKWDSTNHVVHPVVAGDEGSAAVAATVVGVAHDTQPITSLKQDLDPPRINIVTRGLVEFTAQDAATYFPGDLVTLGDGAQTIKKTGASAANAIGVVASENFFDVTSGAADGIVAVAGVTKILIYLKPQFTDLTSF